MTTATDLRTIREAVVREHMASENTQDFDVTLATFVHPRYELVPTGQVYDGEEEVSKYYTQTRTAFPDQHNDNVELHHMDDGVVVEFDLLGTHLGQLGRFEPTGKSFRSRMVAFFIFDGERIVCERVYWDTASIQRQLGLPPFAGTAD